jgi:hypothetical protein
MAQKKRPDLASPGDGFLQSEKNSLYLLNHIIHRFQNLVKDDGGFRGGTMGENQPEG